MKKVVRKTGDHGIGQMVHVVHMTDDVPELQAFYENVFGGFVYLGVDEPTYLDVEDRYASLLMIGDLCVEVMAPKPPVNATKPVGKFYTKYGRHLHSVGYKVDDLPGLAYRLIEKGVYVAKPGGGRLENPDAETMYFFPSPRDTAGLMVELTKFDMPGDPRIEATWSSLAKLWRTHPLTIKRFSSVTLGVRDLDSAVKTYADIMQGEPLRSGVDSELDAEYITLRLGDCLLRIAEPRDESSDLGKHVARWGNMIYSLHFQVADLGSASSWLDRHDVRTRRISARTIVTDERDTFGAPIYFSTADTRENGDGA
ncbi:hypothetical protein HFP15_01710 [Amycolatopsis sp. K13G38]|uniref:VOC domain-containing protein n=1 Tax=Amycolatopsis acididurans TaxID=2724524 RepID=A0ABX1IZY0_9PSEU|nr:VOC family protein [Amycolatopsis acididurans]NKQ51592.1 hypothetical protein [Amycolatopsis acididurans]